MARACTVQLVVPMTICYSATRICLQSHLRYITKKIIKLKHTMIDCLHFDILIAQIICTTAEIDLLITTGCGDTSVWWCARFGRFPCPTILHVNLQNEQFRLKLKTFYFKSLDLCLVYKKRASLESSLIFKEGAKNAELYPVP